MITMSICFDCKRFIGKKGNNLTCKEYPDGIPDKIFLDLKKGQECKKGIVFEAKEASE